MAIGLHNRFERLIIDSDGAVKTASLKPKTTRTKHLRRGKTHSVVGVRRRRRRRQNFRKDEFLANSTCQIFN